MEVLDLAVAHLADHHGLRFLESESAYVGLLRGAFVSVGTHDRNVTIYATAQGAALGDEILEDFAGFVRTRAIVSEATIEPAHVATGGGHDPHGCVLALGLEPLDDLSEEQFLALPEALLDDLAAHGGITVPVTCHLCEESADTMLRWTEANGTVSLRPVCDACHERLLDRAPNGRLAPADPVQWGPAMLTIAITSVLFAAAWGAVQSAEELTDFVVFFAPIGAAFVIATFLNQFSVGRDWRLQAMSLVAYSLALLWGNAWGVRAHFLRLFGIEIPLWKALGVYLNDYLPNNLANESAFLVGGIAGAGALYWQTRPVLERFE